MNININFPRGNPMLGGMNPMLGGFGGGMNPMLAGLQGMGFPGMGFGGDQLMSSMMMMVMGQMMTLMGQMMAQNGGNFPLSMSPANFGAPGTNGCGCGPLGGSPINDFLGGPQNNGEGFPGNPYGNGGYGGGAQGAGGYGGAQGAGGNGAVSGPSPLGPGGKVGNIDINKLVQALPPARRKSAQKHFPFIVAEAQKQGITNKAQLAYILATATHESGAGAFMEEFDNGRKYEGRRTLGNTQPGDGPRYKGRGYVQLTGRRNYADWSRRLGMDLVGNPDKVKDPAIAAKILVGGMKGGTFTGKSLDKYINGQKTDFEGARRTVNGNDKAGLIADMARKLMAAMD